MGSGPTRPKVSVGPQARRALLQSTEPHEVLSRNPPAPSLSVVKRWFVGSEGRTLAQDVSQHSCLNPWTSPCCHFMSSDCRYQALPKAFHTCDCKSLQGPRAPGSFPQQPWRYGNMRKPRLRTYVARGFIGDGMHRRFEPSSFAPSLSTGQDHRCQRQPSQGKLIRSWGIPWGRPLTCDERCQEPYHRPAWRLLGQGPPTGDRLLGIGLHSRLVPHPPAGTWTPTPDSFFIAWLRSALLRHNSGGKEQSNKIMKKDVFHWALKDDAMRSKLFQTLVTCYGMSAASGL